MSSRKHSTGSARSPHDASEEVVSEVTDMGGPGGPDFDLDDDELPELTSASSMANPRALDENSVSGAVEPQDELPQEEEEPEEDLPPPRSKTETRVAAVEDEEPADPEAEDQDATRAGSPILLEVVEGPDAGKSKRFNRVRMVIGRAGGCEFRLTDQSVSRRHVELVQGEKGVLCRDLASGNGSRVNGVEVTEQVLSDGDQISIGKTVIRFIDEVAAFNKLREEAKEREDSEAEAPEEKPAAPEGGEGSGEGEEKKTEEEDHTAVSKVGVPLASKWTLAQKAVAGGVGALGLLLLVLLLATRGPSAPDPKQLAQDRMELALIAVRAERFADAIRLIKEAERLSPGIDTEKLLERATQEAAAQQVLGAARDALSKGLFDLARVELKEFPANASNVRLEERDKLNDEIDRLQVDYWRTEAERLLRAGDLEGGRALFNKLPPEKQAQLQALLEMVEEEIRAQQRRDVARAAQLQAQRLQKATAERQAVIDAAFAVVARKFHAGEYQRAASECDRVVDQNRGDTQIRARAKQLQSLIPTFGRNFEEGTRKYKANQLSLAIKPLRKARELYGKIDFPGAIGQQIDEQLASALFASARDAMAREDYVTAANGFREASRLDGSDQRLRDALERLESKAQELYQDGYMIRDRDPKKAISRFRTVLQITSPGSEVHEKAKGQLAALQP